MYLLLDTSQNKTLLAIASKKEVIVCKKKTLKGRQSLLLITLIEEMLNDLDITTEKLKGIIIVSGPGSYTGLRIGISIVNALSFGLNIPVAGISKYEIASMFFNDKLFAIPSYQDYYLVAKKNKKAEFTYQMTSKKNLDLQKEKLVVIGRQEKEKNSFEYFDYQNKKSLNIWFKKFFLNLKRQQLSPFYFQKPNITT